MSPRKRKGPLAQSAAAAAAVLRAAGHAAPAPDVLRPEGELLLGGGGYIDPKDRVTQRFALACVELSRRSVGLVPTGFLPHGIAVDPLRPERLIAFEKIGPGCCEVDLAGGELVRSIAPTEGRWFYGHGAFSPDGKLLYSTETVNGLERGVIGVRDAATLQYLGEFPTFGENPHDCRLIEGGGVLVVTNGGGALGSDMRPCVAYVDVTTRRLLEKLELHSERFNTGHLAVTAGGGLVIVSAPRKGLSDTEPGAVSMRSGHDTLRTMTEPAEVAARMLGEALSVEVHEPSGVAAVTHPSGDMVTLWSLDGPRLLKVVELPRARGLALTRDGGRFLVSYGVTAELVEIDPASLDAVPGSGLSRSFLTGSHLFHWNRLTAQ
ncbi:MAG: DUF1513 domain-containing protein [Burkholderiales bacterium]